MARAYLKSREWAHELAFAIYGALLGAATLASAGGAFGAAAPFSILGDPNRIAGAILIGGGIIHAVGVVLNGSHRISTMLRLVGVWLHMLVLMVFTVEILGLFAASVLGGPGSEGPLGRALASYAYILFGGWWAAWNCSGDFRASFLRRNI